MTGEDEWTYRVAALRDQAMNAATLEEATARIDEAFAVIEAEGDERHIVFASVLCLAADFAMEAHEPESAASLYKRASEVATSHGVAGIDILAKAMRGLADADVARGWIPRAKERYAEALSLLTQSRHPDAPALRAAIEASLRSLDS